MIKKTLVVLFACISLLTNAQEKDSLIKVTEQVYMISGLGGNVTFLLTNDYVLVIDCGTERTDGNIIQKHIRKITGSKIKYIVYTHYHRDHVNGIGGMPVINVNIIGHENVVSNIKELGIPSFEKYKSDYLAPKVAVLKEKVDSLQGDYESKSAKLIVEEYNTYSGKLYEANQNRIRYPDITFSERMTLCLGFDTINFYYPGPTHTDGNILIDFPIQNVLITGDFLFNNCMPYIDYKAGCNTENWINQLEIWAQKDYDYVIPGHGDIAKPEDMLAQVEYLKDLKEKVKKYIDKGKSLEEIQEKVKMKKYSHFGKQYMLKSEIEAIYREFTD